MNYEEILKCYEGETDIHASTSFEFGLMNDLYYYWDAPIEEDYDWRDAFPDVDCMCEICFDINNSEGKIKWKDDKNPFKCESVASKV